MKPLPRTPERLLRRLEWTVLQRLDGLLQGNYRSHFRGAGLDLADIREYQDHDDVRHIDWNVTARLQTPHVRQYLEDREVAVWFLLDLSPSMDFGSGARSKRARLEEFVTVLAQLFSGQGNRVGAIIYSGKLDAVIKPATGRRHLLDLINRIMRHPVLPVAPSTRLAELVATANRVAQRRSVIFLVSDFISAPGWEKPLGMLGQRHETTAVRLIDPLETRLPDLGLVTMQDSESGEQLLVDTHDAGFRRRFEQLVREQDDALIDRLVRSGTDVLELGTDDDLLHTLLRYIRMRQGRPVGTSTTDTTLEVAA